MNLEVVILAAGQGKRMKSRIPKVLHKVGGKPMLEHVVETVRELSPKKIHVVCSEVGEDDLRQLFADQDINWVVQKKRLGTADAVSQAVPYLSSKNQVLILYGDVPLIRKDILIELIESKPSEFALITAELNDPYGFGRIVRNNNRQIMAIVEDKDCSRAQREINEINTGIMAMPVKLLIEYLPMVKPNNAQKEYYLTDLVSLLVADGRPMHSVLTNDIYAIQGINDRAQLAELERYYQKRQAGFLMQQGLGLSDPNRFDLRGSLRFGRDCQCDCNIILEGEVKLGDNVSVGSNVVLRNVTIGNNVRVLANTIIEDSVIGDDCVIGPFARIRPDSDIKNQAKIGNFVELKKTEVGKGSKVNHLSYIGDSIIGENVNIGAGTITCNYDGVNKNQTIVQDGAFVGSNCQLVAPVTIGKNATIAAGSTVTDDAPEGKLTIARSKQMTVERWQRPKKRK
ncbi:MAG: bifunctional UDP-N-acetylglucosamine diphosphorylase/glucosamine-1-phosphate N-acetyltransferase GlmU [Gammaproteobacteria bacterium]|nr:bifunctional UDP-N-acetylglucosamine diphosphorylase/glucosamine-1-phosphate N-acetyltransferase GlmU [Gammaproteobacteria bacterium]